MKRPHDLAMVKVKPRSSHPGVEVGAEGEVIVRVRAAAVEGAANREMLEVLAHALEVPRSAIRILRGERSRTKQVAVNGLSAGEIALRLAKGRSS